MNARQKAKKYKKDYQRLKDSYSPFNQTLLTSIIRCYPLTYAYKISDTNLSRINLNENLILEKVKKELVNQFAEHIYENINIKEINLELDDWNFGKEYEATIYIGFDDGQKE